MADQILMQTVLEEIKWDPSVNASHIGVTARRGVITLTGRVDSYFEKWAARRGVERVSGVKSIVDEIEVGFVSRSADEDEDLANRAVRLLEWAVGVPDERIQVRVVGGWVTLSGHVDWFFQKHNAERCLRMLRGVVGVIDSLMIDPAIEANDISSKINTALRRTAFFNHDNVVVAAEGGKVTLRGHVDTYYERTLAFKIACSAPGVIAVDNLLTVD